MKGLRGCAAALLVASLLVAALGRAQVGAAEATVTPAQHVRGLEQTLLTYPEWFLVFSPQEYADYTQQHPPSGFPWWGHVWQFWQGYAEVALEAWRRELEVNPGYHLMVLVIGFSTTVEYGLRSGYEMLIGRMTESLASGPTPEDRYAARAARDYVDFIRERPWYEFDFDQRLIGLWHETGWWGEDMLRKWERKLVLSTEYGIKSLYAGLIRRATRGIYEQPLPVTAVVTRTVPPPDARWPKLQVERVLPDGSALLLLPRYEAFTSHVQALADKGVQILEVAGNRHFILASVHAPSDWEAPLETPTLIDQPILTRPGVQRLVLLVPVSQLSAQMRQWKTAGLAVEHVFDY